MLRLDRRNCVSYKVAEAMGVLKTACRGIYHELQIILQLRAIYEHYFYLRTLYVLSEFILIAAGEVYSQYFFRLPILDDPYRLLILHASLIQPKPWLQLLKYYHHKLYRQPSQWRFLFAIILAIWSPI